jgi:hypothetical protein
VSCSTRARVTFFVGSLERHVRAGAGRILDGGRPWLHRLAAHVARRPLVVGTAVRVVLHTGLAVEGFFVATGYTRCRYLMFTTVGIALYVAQTVVGVTALAAPVRVSPWLGLVLVAIPLGLVVALGAGWARSHG